MKTKYLIAWVENLLNLAQSEYEPIDTDQAYFKEIKTRLEKLDEIKKDIEHNIYVDHIRDQQD